MKYKTFLVTGGAGFVGSHLVDLLVEKGAEKVVVVDSFLLGKQSNLDWAMRNGNVVVYREDARYLTALENIVGHEKPEAVFDLAVKCLPYGFIDPEGAYMTSVEIAHNLACLLKKKRFIRLLHFSSSEAYGSAETVPMSENHPLNPTTPYAAGKASADHLLLSYQRLFSSEITVLRPFNIYGPRQNIGAYAAVIPVTIRRILRGERPVVEGTGEQTRDFTFVKDVVNAALNLLECDAAVGKVVNVGQGKETSILTVIKKICEVLDAYPFGDFEYRPERPADVKRHCADLALIKQLIKYSPETKLNKGLELTVSWFRHYDA